MRKRLFSLLCCAALLLTLPMASVAEQTFSMAGFDGDDSYHTWSENAFFTRMEARTGVSFTFDEYTDYDKWQQKKQEMFASGELPDVLFKAALSTSEQRMYADRLVDLAPLLQENAPNLWALLQANPDWLAAITLEDGRIVALPLISELSNQNAMWINRTWLDKLNLSMPTDAESLAEVLRAFKTGDPNQNGKSDEIPLSFNGPWELAFLGHAFGVVENDWHICLTDGTVRFVPEEDGYFELLRWLSALYAEGLLDSQGFYTSDSLRTVTDDNAVATYGVFFGPTPTNLLTFELASQYEMLMPLAFDGKQIYRDMDTQVTRGAFAITTACDDPAALLRWVDVLYGEEGAIEALAGVEGEDYVVSPNGTWTYADAEAKSAHILYDLSVYDTGSMPWLFPEAFYERYDSDTISAVNASVKALAACLVKPFPTVSLTAEQAAEIAPVQSALGRYVDESFGKFVLGQWDVNDPTTVEAYRAGLSENGKESLVNFWQGIADGLSKK